MTQEYRVNSSMLVVDMVDPTNPKAIADAITYLYEHPDEARQMGERGKNAVINEYNWNTEMINLNDLYSHVLNRN